MENKRDKIINGLRGLKEECEKESPSNCPDKCPYEDICEMISGGQPAVVVPAMFEFGELKSSSK